MAKLDMRMRCFFNIFCKKLHKNLVEQKKSSTFALANEK